MLIRAYRVRGHLKATLDPARPASREPHPELDPRPTASPTPIWTAPIFINNVLGMRRRRCARSSRCCAQTYCGTIGVEFMHIQDPDQKAWIQERIEAAATSTDFTASGKRAILRAADRGRDVRALPRQAIHRHQALRPGRRRDR